MGMAASQSTLLALTARVHDISYDLENLSLEKLSLTRQMQKVSENYQRALCSKVLKWSNNGGINYTELTYNTLMSPGAANNNNPVLLSDSSGKIIVDEKYAQYAAMISSDGMAGGDYESNRYEILSALTGIPVSTLKSQDSASSSTSELYEAMQKAKLEMEAVPRNDYATEDIISKIFHSESSSSKLSSSNVDDFVKVLKTKITPYFTAELVEKFNSACDTQAANVKKGETITQADFLTAVVNVMTDATTVSMFIDNKDNGTMADYNIALEKYQEAEEAYNSASQDSATILNGTAETQIAFYDQLFAAIAELGWKQDSSVTDSDYLNQMLQNNSYYVVTMTKNNSYDDSLPTDNINYLYDYDTESAANFSNIFSINDSDARTEAYATYEYEKSKISEKESRIDQRMTNLETEKSSIEKEIESIEKVKDDNVENNFNVFG